MNDAVIAVGRITLGFIFLIGCMGFMAIIYLGMMSIFGECDECKKNKKEL